MAATQSESDSTIISWFEDVLHREAAAIEQAARRCNADSNIADAVRLVANCNGRLIVAGMGKMGCIARKAAGTFSSTGTPAIFLDPADAAHGGLGVVTTNDIVLAISNSGETKEVLDLIPFLLRHRVPLIALTGNLDSSLAKQANLVIDARIDAEADPDSLAPTNSSTVALACCDGLAVALMRLRGFTKEQFAIFHPGGHLGRKLLLKVRDLMHSGEQLPVLDSSVTLGQAITRISQKQRGAVLIQNANRELAGVLTDGDVRRIFERTANSNLNPLKDSITQFMTTDPTCIDADDLAAVALNLMEEKQISVLPVLDSSARIVGIVHLHDLIRSGLV